MEFNEKTINDIILNITVPLITESSKQLIAMVTTLNNDLSKHIIDMNTVVSDALINKIDKMQIENLRNLSFIKAVLFAQNLSNEECYAKYIAEWNRLNEELLHKFIVDPIHKNDDKSSSECIHEKVYEDYVLTSNPPKYPWKCKKCGEHGVDDTYHP